MSDSTTLVHPAATDSATVLPLRERWYVVALVRRNEDLSPKTSLVGQGHFVDATGPEDRDSQFEAHGIDLMNTMYAYCGFGRDGVVVYGGTSPMLKKQLRRQIDNADSALLGPLLEPLPTREQMCRC